MNLTKYKQLIDAFTSWYPPQQYYESGYQDQLTLEKLNALDKESFIAFFYDFYAEGGKIQSGGHRTKNRFRETLVNDYEAFRDYLLQPFHENFKVLDWLEERKKYNQWGEGISTIYLNRINPKEYPVINNKTVDGLRLLGFTISSTYPAKYNDIRNAQLSLMAEFPDLKDFFKTDRLNQFIVGELQGKQMIRDINPELYKELENKRTDPFSELIETYKQHLTEDGLTGEIYKWKAVKHFLETWNPDAPNFGEMFAEAIKQQINLIHWLSFDVINSFCKSYPDELKAMILNLYNEAIPLPDRIIEFQRKSSELIGKTGKNKKDNQDERAISLYLFFRYPEIYIHYQDAFYSWLIKAYGFSKSKPGNKYIHYQEVAQRFKTEYVTTDEELVDQVQASVPTGLFQDPELNLLTQDVLYYAIQPKNINYWIFQGNPNIYDVKGALRDNALRTWKVTAHKNRIRNGDKVILWVTGDKSGCYALCTVKSDVMVIPDYPEEIPYNLVPDENVPTEKVEIVIEYNLWSDPIPKSMLVGNPVLADFKVGNQGTNFMATKNQYDAIIQLINNKMPTENIHYWLWSPDHNASIWEEFYNKGLMGIGWDKLGDFSEYESKEEIIKKLQSLDNTDNSKKNNGRACFEFLKVIKPGDIIIPKKGRTTYLGYGIVRSDYFYDPARERITHLRKVEWKKKGSWEETKGPIVLKTLTDITKYPEYVDKLIDLIGIQARKNNNPDQLKSFGTLNRILYGPPGTGKTYHSLNHAIAIIESKKLSEVEIEDRKELRTRYEQYVSDGRIIFSTFHQSMSYEDFIEGIKPLKPEESQPVKYDVVNGIFKQIAVKAAFSFIDLESDQPAVAETMKYDTLYDEYISELSQLLDQKSEVPIKTRTGGDIRIVDITDHDNIELKHPDGGRTYIVSKQRLSILFDNIPDENKISNINTTFRSLIGGSNATAYWSVLHELKEREKKFKPQKQANREIQYSDEDKERLVRKMDWKQIDFTKKQQPYVIIIDEINRGNVSNIFGELITLIEEDKRLGNKEALQTLLPYSKSSFGVPPNLYLIGTMNTADRSVEALDTALRRRFCFVEIAPRYDLDELQNEIIEEITLADLLELINKRIEKLLDKDHMIGHSYFMEVLTPHDLQMVFHNKLLPLLHEYFYGDPGKIGLILDKGFFVDNGKAKSEKILANFEPYDNAEDLEEKLIFHLKNIENMSDEDFMDAIMILMNVKKDDKTQ